MVPDQEQTNIALHIVQVAAIRRCRSRGRTWTKVHIWKKSPLAWRAACSARHSSTSAWNDAIFGGLDERTGHGAEKKFVRSGSSE
jgi:hypothetical protein